MGNLNYGYSDWKNYEEGILKEWILTNGISGFSSLSIVGASARKQSGTLIATLNSPEERYMVLSNISENVFLNGKEYNISTTKYRDKLDKGFLHQNSFMYDGTPHFKYLIEDSIINKEIYLKQFSNTVIIKYEIINGSSKMKFKMKPFMCFRELNEGFKKENLEFNKNVIDNSFLLNPKSREDANITIKCINASIDSTIDEISNNVYYDLDKLTGEKNPYERFYIPGSFSVELNKFQKKTIYFICSLNEKDEINPEEVIDSEKERITNLKKTFKEDRLLAKFLPIAADNFIVRRDSTKSKTILAGFPWFLDWGRDTTISLTGLTMCLNRLDDAKEILKSFSLYEKDGLIPNMFPGNNREPLYNTVDASLWFINAVYNYCLYSNSNESLEFVKNELYDVLKNIINGYKKGTNFSIKMDHDGLILAGSGLDQVTWMDVCVNGIVVTPRHGKPVEINALWYNALNILGYFYNKFEGGALEDNEYFILAKKVHESFNKKFFNQSLNCLYDVINDDEKDSSIRPNQIWAVSLPFTMLSKEKERLVVQKVFKELYTPYGLRSLDKNNIEYKGEYSGELFKRDMAYHQGTVWNFPLGAFFTAYLKVNDYKKENIEFVDSLLKDLEEHLKDGCIGSIAEIFDGEAPHTSRGCFAQAWSVAETIRVYYEDILGNHKNLKKAHKELFLNTTKL